MILSDKLILEEIERGNIIIEPFKKECLGTNSHDVHLGKYLATYRNRVHSTRFESMSGSPVGAEFRPKPIDLVNPGEWVFHHRGLFLDGDKRQNLYNGSNRFYVPMSVPASIERIAALATMHQTLENTGFNSTS